MIDDLICPNCKAQRLNKVGFLWSGQNKRQRYVCRDCHKTTIRPESIASDVRTTDLPQLHDAIKIWKIGE